MPPKCYPSALREDDDSLVSLPIVSSHAQQQCPTIGADEAEALDMATRILRDGGLVALPTETVYGLAARISEPSAIQRLYSAKGRPTNHPLIVHVDSAARTDEYATRIPSPAREAMDAFWPGPLTLLLHRTSVVSSLVTGGRDTVAVRCPANEFFRNVITRLDDVLVAPSANRFGHVSPTRAHHVRADLGKQIDLIVDGGSTVLGLESTIIDFTTSVPQVLRHGALPCEDIEDVLDITLDTPHGQSRASGMLASHYAPRARIQLVRSDKEARAFMKTLESSGESVRVLEHASHLPTYAATIYHQLRQADEDGVGVVIAVLPPEHGIGAAISDRLRKAAVTPFTE